MDTHVIPQDSAARKLLSKYERGDFSEVAAEHLLAFLAQTRLVEARIVRELRRRDHER